MTTKQGRIILVALAAATVLSLWHTTRVEREKGRLADEYAKVQQLVNELSTERDTLTTQLASAQDTVEGQTGELGSLQEELRAVQARLDQTVADLASLQRDHEQIRGQNTSLTTQIASVTVEKEQLESKLSSLKELRLAIRDVKQRMWHERWASWRARADAQKDADREALASGNRGFIVRGGKSTVVSGPRLHIHVLEPQTQ